jgi:hypothetical protein
MVDGHRENLSIGVALVSKLKPMPGDPKIPANSVGQPPDRHLSESCGSLGQSKERGAIPVGQDTHNPSWINLARIGFSGTEKRGRARHATVEKVLGDPPCVGKLGGTHCGIVPLRSFRVDWDVGRFPAERKLHAVLAKDRFRA